MKAGTLLRLKDVKQADEGFSNLRENGFSCCQLVYKPEVYTTADAAIVREAAKHHGIEISAMFAGFRDTHTKWNLYSDFRDAGINSQAYGAERIAYIKQAAVFCQALGCEDVLIHAGFVANDPFSKDYRRMVELVEDLARYLKTLSLHLLLETGGESPITLKRLIADTGCDNVFVNLDTANLIMYGFGNPVDAVYTLGSYIRGMHVKDGMPPQDPNELGVETEFGKGFVDFERVLSLLKAVGFDGPYIIEREISDDAAAENIRRTFHKLRQMIE